MIPDPFEQPLPEPETEAGGTFTLALTLRWSSPGVEHSDCQVLQKINQQQEKYPPELGEGLRDQPRGTRVTHRWAHAEPLPPYREDDVLDIPDSAFNRHLRRRIIEPRAGRFYPRGFIAGVRGLLRENRTPFRVGSVAEGMLTIDLNHPMAGKDIELQARALDIRHSRHSGTATHGVVELAAHNGPGMQARWCGEPTDFWSDDPFRREDPAPDTRFYEKPRFVQHLDRTALAGIRRLYGALVPPESTVLDLMSSWVSHLDEVASPARVAGLGLNAEELDANPALSERRIHDLNTEPHLPWEDGTFDAVVCTVSVEYLVHPVTVFSEVHRVLRPGGRFIVTFSDRWFPPKAIALWEDLHPFERMGLVVEYFLATGGFGGITTWSLRGLPRPSDDKYADRLTLSDPVFAVWGHKEN